MGATAKTRAELTKFLKLKFSWKAWKQSGLVNSLKIGLTRLYKTFALQGHSQDSPTAPSSRCST
jgi:hypothetical protein